VITTEDGDRIAFFCEGVVTVDGGAARLGRPAPRGYTAINGTTAMVRIRLFGPPCLERDGRSIEMPSRRAHALLAYLAVTAQRQSREALAALLYPSLDRAHTSSAFRNCLSRLRAAAGDAVVRVERGAVWLNDGPGVEVDVRAFRRLCSDHQRSVASGDGHGIVERLTAADRLVRGEFLAGLGIADSPAFDEWQLLERESVGREHASVLNRLVDALEARGDLAAAIAHAGRWLTLDILDEAAYRRLMALFDRAGNRAAALKQFEDCRAILLRELGQEPDEETRALADRIQRGSTAGRGIRRPSRSGATRQRRASAPAVSRPGEPEILLALGWRPLRGLARLPASSLAAGRPGAHTGLLECLERAGGAQPSCTDRGRTARFASARAAVDAALAAVASRSGIADDGGMPAEGLAAALHAAAGPGGSDDSPIDDAVESLDILETTRAGQVILSSQAAGKAYGCLPADATLRSLGAHRLKDLGPSRQLYILAHPALPAARCRLSTLDAVPNNLPCQATPLVDRANELATVLRALGHPSPGSSR